MQDCLIRTLNGNLNIIPRFFLLKLAKVAEIFYSSEFLRKVVIYSIHKLNLRRTKILGKIVKQARIRGPRPPPGLLKDPLLI